MCESVQQKLGLTKLYCRCIFAITMVLRIRKMRWCITDTKLCVLAIATRHRQYQHDNSAEKRLVRKELRERGSYIESEDGFLTMPLSLTKWVLLQQSGAEGGSYGHKHTQYFCKGQRTAKDHSREHIHLKWAFWALCCLPQHYITVTGLDNFGFTPCIKLEFSG